MSNAGRNTVILNEKILANLLFWMQERHLMHLRRKSGQPPPWTDHPVLRNNFFTNPFREHDKTTVWLRQNVREPMANDDRLLMAIYIFRRFNFIPTGEILLREGLLTDWDSPKAIALLRDQPKVFTGAYMIPSPRGVEKLTAICSLIDQDWIRREFITTNVKKATTLKEAFHLLQSPYHQGLMPYEVVTDLRWTHFLADATDINTWAHFGPGGQRGCLRLLGQPVYNKATLPQQECLRVARAALPLVQAAWSRIQLIDHLGTDSNNELLTIANNPPIEFRDLEHSLCEMDKFIRLCEGSGYTKRIYAAN